MGNANKKCAENLSWVAADLANALGPFGSLERLKELLETYPAPDSPEYQYFHWLASGLDPAYLPPKALSVPDHLAVLDTLAHISDDWALAQKAAGLRDGILIQFGDFD